MYDIDLVDRIQKIYDSCCPEEQQYLLQILSELAETGTSKTYEDVWLADYKEIPVDKTTFLTDPYYLGNSNDCGKSIYPVWLETMQELERAGNQYWEIVFSGATRTGKTSTAVSDSSYNLYRLMCLRDPQKYFGLKSVTTISIFFFNLNATLAKGVAFKEFNSTLATSPWFQQHGHFTRSEQNPIYVPEGGLIEISYGSDASHALGKAVYCLVGTTKVLTADGYKALQDIAGPCKVAQLTPEDTIIYVDAYTALTKYTQDTIKITLADGSTIEGTPEHKIMLSDGSYKALGEITLDDDIKNL